jgi:hypothetical protein
VRSFVHVTVTVLRVTVLMKLQWDQVDDRSIAGEKVETLCKEHIHMW